MVYTLSISLGAILNFQWLTSFAERSYTWPKWLPKIKALLTLILQCVDIIRNFLLYIKRNIFLIQCLYGYVMVTLKLSCKDIPGSMISRANESWFKCQKNCELKFWLNRRGLRQQTPGNLFLAIVLILFHFLWGLY